MDECCDFRSDIPVRQRRILRIVLWINAVMFVVELVADPLSHERSGRHASGVLVGPIPPVEADVLVLVSETLQAFAKGRQRGWLMVEADVEEPNPPDLPRWLRLDDARRGGDSDEPCQEGSPVHDTSTERAGGTA